MNKEEIIQRINTLPKGSIAKKKIKDKYYYYRRFYIDGKRKEVFIPFEELDTVTNGIKERKELEKKLKELNNETYYTFDSPLYLAASKPFDYHVCDVLTGSLLRQLIDKSKDYKKRYCFSKLQDYLYKENTGRVFILYGLRRTGKTTMIHQAILDMREDDFNKTALIQLHNYNKMSDLNYEFKLLQANGYKYVFVDEVTLMSDFIGGSSVLADIYSASNMRIVLSGTDSLGFWLSKSDALYDRTILLHTTYISYKEFENVLGIKGIDNYIEYGGTMCPTGKHYNNPFSSKEGIDEYIDSSIAHNIGHSLKYYEDGNYFGVLNELYKNNELTNVINRVVEDINHRFTLDVLTRDFNSNDLALSKNNLRSSNDILDRVDLDKINNKLKDLLEIKNNDETIVKIREDYALKIYEYLKLLDIVYEVNGETRLQYSKFNKVIISQPGLRYSQAKYLIESLLDDTTFSKLSTSEKNEVISRILNEIKGRMMEDIVLLETSLSMNNKNVFVLRFDVGEIDMVVQDKETYVCDLYEIKHSDKIVSKQYRHLIDEDKCQIIEKYYGRINSKNVLYRGDNQIINNINYINVEEYLNSLS